MAALLAAACKDVQGQGTIPAKSHDPFVVHTGEGRAVIHLDAHGADVQLPEGATVHVRFGQGR